jgi:biofilm PGA synthesis N-glycosyltransferase PgaC
MSFRMSRRYCLITPCRDEAQFARRTLDSVLWQTNPPALWVIVDDGSRDDTPKILQEYAQRVPFIRIVRREDRGGRSVGPGVIDAFYAGYDTINPAEFDYVCKLDLDLEMPCRYFEILMDRMEANPRLGACSGKPYYPGPDGQLVSEGCGDETAIGASKFYRRQCFQEIGGFVRQVMWDGIDCHRCRMLGWIACSWDEPDLRFTHFRPMGSSHKGIVTGRMRHGFGQYFMGTGLAYMTASSLFRMMRRPRIVGGAAMWWGYVRSWLRREARYDDPAFRRFVRRYQWAALLLGKQKAIERVNRTQEAVWLAHHGARGEDREVSKNAVPVPR